MDSTLHRACRVLLCADTSMEGFCCRASTAEAKSVMELYVRGVLDSGDFDKDVFDMEHFVVCSS